MGGTRAKSGEIHSPSQKTAKPNPLWLTQVGWASREGGRVGVVNEQPRRAVKGLPRVVWYGVWRDS